MQRILRYGECSVNMNYPLQMLGYPVRQVPSRYGIAACKIR